MHQKVEGFLQSLFELLTARMNDKEEIITEVEVNERIESLKSELKSLLNVEEEKEIKNNLKRQTLLNFQEELETCILKKGIDVTEYPYNKKLIEMGQLILWVVVNGVHTQLLIQYEEGDFNIWTGQKGTFDLVKVEVLYKVPKWNFEKKCMEDCHTSFGKINTPASYYKNQHDSVGIMYIEEVWKNILLNINETRKVYINEIKT